MVIKLVIRKVSKKALKKGIKKGIRKGREEGVKEGLEKGREEGTKQIAIKLLNLGQDLDMFAKITGLSAAEIQEINAKLQSATN